VLIPDRFKNIHPSHRHDFSTEPRKRTMGSGLELFGRKKDETEFPVEISLSPIESKEGVLVSASIRDVTERKKEERNQRRLAAIVENASDFIGFADAKDKHIIYINGSGRKMIGVSKDEDITKLKIENVHPDLTNKLLNEESIPKAIQNGIWRGECVFLNIKTKREIPVSMMLLSHKTAEGEIEFFSTISRDISENKITENKLKYISEELERSNNELEQFAYMASHDLQEPLRTISSYLQLIADRYKGKLDNDANEFIDFTVDGSKRMRQMINSLLEYSRVNRIKPFEQVNIKDILDNILLDLGDTIRETHALIQYENLPVIYCDQVLIGQLFQNLISNALKFRNVNKKPEIRITCEKQNGNYLFSVKDNGIGIQKEYWEKIFVIFKRLNSRETYPGTGIGLSICKKIVEKHGGKIWVESEPGKGAIFYFTLKMKRVKGLTGLLKTNDRQIKHIAH
jgi:PAS domain S-box-containing protein